MDLMRTMIANRNAPGAVLNDPKPRASGKKKPTKADRAKENMPGSRQMRAFIVEEKPGKKIVREHLEAMMVEDSSDDE